MRLHESNSINSDPGRNLGFHGFRMKKAKQQQDGTVEEIMEIRNTQFISYGRLHPLSERSNVEAGTKKAKISEVEDRMMRKISDIFYASGRELNRVKGQVGLYAAHFRSGQKEQKEFLKFYSDKEVITSHSQTGFV